MFENDGYLSKILKVITVIPIIWDIGAKIYKFFKREKNEQ